MKKIFSSILFLIIGAAASASIIYALRPWSYGNLEIIGNGPSENSTIAEYTWTDQVAHTEWIPDEPVADCKDAANDSQCLLTYAIDPSLIPAEETHLAVKVKSKAWVMGNTGAVDYALVYGRSVQPTLSAIIFSTPRKWKVRHPSLMGSAGE